MFTEFISPFPWLAKACSVDRVYFTDQGSQPEGYIPARAPLWKRMAFRFINQPLTGVISISEYNAKSMRARDTYPAGRIRRIFNGVRVPDPGGRCPDTFRERYAIPRGRSVILQVGSIIPEKGVGDLIEAARLVLEKNDSAQFVFVGDGEGLEHFREQARPLGDHITWTGLVARPISEGVYHAAEVVCQASRWQEAFGWVIAEAMSVSRPVVATDAGGIPELVEDGVTGFLVPRRDTAALADRILRLLADPVLRGRFGANGRRAVEQNFDIRDIVAQYLEMFGVGEEG
jgi:glycosyltransferase involved in cell wall biosynthesis